MSLRVETYSGYKADERPVRFVWNGKAFDVSEIFDRWYEPSAVCYRVHTRGGGDYLLRHRLESWAGECWEITPSSPRSP